MRHESGFTLEGGRSILDGWPESKSLREAVLNIEEAMDAGSDRAIDAAKCFVESICRTIAAERGVKLEMNTPVKKVLRQTLNTLKLTSQEGGECIIQMVSGMLQAVQALGEMRNQFGPMGHGKDAYHQSTDDWQRTIAVRVSEAIAVLVYESYLRLPTEDRYSKRPFDETKAIHDKMDAAAMVTFDEETHEIVIGDGVRIRPSQILWNYDREAYIEHKLAAKEIPDDEELM